jgi:hypothetical protein
VKINSKSKRNSLSIPVLLHGALAGILATIPMTLFMGAAHYLLPKRQRYPLPPRLITLQAADKVGLKDTVKEEPLFTLTTGAAHFSYGADGGILYSLLARRIPLNSIAKGFLFGIGFWAVGYLGWIPAAGLLRPATEHPTQRALLMLLSNAMYGIFTALFFESLADKKFPRR